MRRPCFLRNSTSSAKRAIVPSSCKISQSTPAGCRPANCARSIAASVCPARRNTPPSFARNGKTCPGCTRSSGDDFGFATARIVVARSNALIPVVTPRAASTETVKSVRYISRFCATIRCRPSCSARSFEMGTQIKPRPCVAMKLTASGVAFSAAMTRSPSFSRSASSVTMTMRPFAMSLTTSSIVSN